MKATGNVVKVEVDCRRPAATTTSVPPSVAGGKAYFKKMKETWRRGLASLPTGGSWLESAPPGQDWGLGCRVCRLAVNAVGASPWTCFGIKGTSVKTHCIRRHSASQAHLDAVEKLVGSGSGALLDDALSAPNLDDFKQILAERRKGMSHNALTDVACRKKVLKMSWCLAEALKDRQRARLGKAQVIAIHQDAREQHLLVKFSAVGVDLQPLHGVLGIARDYGTTAKDTYQATVEVLKQFCTPRLQPPTTSSLSSALDQSLFDHIRKHIELFDADAASDEQRAGRMLQGKVLGANQVFNRLKLVLRDRTHAATRPALSDSCHGPCVCH